MARRRRDEEDGARLGDLFGVVAPPPACAWCGEASHVLVGDLRTGVRGACVSCVRLGLTRAAPVCNFCWDADATTTAPEEVSPWRTVARPACQGCSDRLEGGPSDDETFNAPGTEGGVNY